MARRGHRRHRRLRAGLPVVGADRHREHRPADLVGTVGFMPLNLACVVLNGLASAIPCSTPASAGPSGF